MKTLEQMGADQSAKVTAGREEILYQARVGWERGWMGDPQVYIPIHGMNFEKST